MSQTVWLDYFVIEIIFFFIWNCVDGEQDREIKMGENSVDFGEMLPIPAELIEESKKNIAIVQDSGQVIDLNEQGNI